MKKVVVIGDIHGKSVWKEIVNKEADADTIIFIGDYLDSSNLKMQNYSKKYEIVEIVKNRWGNLVLLNVYELVEKPVDEFAFTIAFAVYGLFVLKKRVPVPFEDIVTLPAASIGFPGPLSRNTVFGCNCRGLCGGVKFVFAGYNARLVIRASAI